MSENNVAGASNKTVVERADRKIADAVGGGRETIAVKILGKFSELADQPPLIAVSIATAVVGVVRRDGVMARTGARMLGSHLLATAAKSFIKHRVDRTRPAVTLSSGEYHARKGKSRAKEETSFPSGHTAGAVTIARAIVRDYPGTAPYAYGLAAAAGAIQLPRAAHFATDVLAGAVIGFAAEAMVGKLFLRSNPALRLR